jgi:uncharacterized membrane protein HdeD (DUF308 family)
MGILVIALGIIAVVGGVWYFVRNNQRNPAGSWIVGAVLVLAGLYVAVNGLWYGASELTGTPSSSGSVESVSPTSTAVP